MPTHYLNTDLDLDLDCPHDLSPLIAALRCRGLDPLPHPTGRRDGNFFVVFETDDYFTTPEATLVVMLDAVESLPEDAIKMWRQCTKREFNIGIECDSKQHAGEFAIAPELLQRIAAVGGSLGITVYANET